MKNYMKNCIKINQNMFQHQNVQLLKKLKKKSRKKISHVPANKERTNKNLVHIPGHSTPLTCMGAFILIIGFISMNIGHGKNVSLSVTNLILGGSAAGIWSMVVTFLKPKIQYLWKYQIKQKLRSRKIR